MALTGVTDLLCDEATVQSALRAARSGLTRLDVVCPAPARPLVVSAIAERADRPLLLVTSTFREAEQLSVGVGAAIGAERVCYYPAWETLPHERLSPRSDIVGRRLAVLRRLAGLDELPSPDVVIAPVRSILQPQVAGLGQLRPVRLRVGQDYDMADVARDLVAAAYARVDLVERRGDFAVRGGIIDIFPPTFEHPVRVEFFGDQVDQIRHFAVADQRSLPVPLEEVVAAPCRELLLTPQVRARAAALVDAHPELSELLERIAQGQAADGMEALAPALVDRLELLIDVMPPDTLVLVADPEMVRSRAGDLARTSAEFLNAGWAAAAAGGQAPIDLGASAYWELADVRRHAMELGQCWWTLSPFAAAPEDATDEGAAWSDGDVPETADAAAWDKSAPAGAESVDDEAAAGNRSSLVPQTLRSPDATVIGNVGATGPELVLHLDPTPGWHGQVGEALAAITSDIHHGWRVVAAVEGRGLADRLAELLHDLGVGARLSDSLDDRPEPGAVTVVVAPLGSGLRAPALKLAVVTGADIAGQAAAAETTRRAMPARRRNQVVPLELKPGDALVHEQHGIGRYVEMAQRTVAGATREYLVLEYAPSKRGQPGDRLWVPMDQLDLVTRYVGGEAPQLDRMGGADWKTRKSRARRAVRQIAAELIKLYAARQATHGHAFGPDTPWQRELEDAFAYVETPDQLSAINDVKHDMEQEVPMDRLICGDVGYGKTEIAVRAAFKAVQDGLQVAVLVPTTLLVSQHLQTFQTRYAGFPVNVAPLSRFQTDAEAKATLDGLSSGRVDIVISTHRLLSDNVHFKDLGLVIIDEEQRFGVEHKEALKRLRVNVDVLSMSATPIPRTLEMAVTGIREMSTISTPPEERHPVLTFVGGFDESQVSAAIRRELAREGQVFFVHNRVQSITKMAARLAQLVPEARIEVAHGQMNEHQLEQVMLDFYERRADVLVCTTIVEAGLDIATANTLLVDGAERMGLSQLHQLRGRVGRGRERGYAYFLYPPEKSMTQTAHDRLAALATNTDLGAGMAIAMRDLEIRGAGNLLGAEQSGHIADVGFDLYLRLVGEAVADFKGDVEGEDDVPMRIELPVDAHLPADYVGSERLRLEMYKRIAEVRGEDDIAQVRAELADRYGPVPPAAEALFAVARFRLLCRAAGLRDVVLQGPFIRFAPIAVDAAAPAEVTAPLLRATLPASRQLRLQRMYPGSIVKAPTHLVLVPRPAASGIPATPLADAELLEWASTLVTQIFLP
ncbi:MAG: transcription-repair coupling factor [Propionibacteriaceae bacterium]|nr:transcription-repair coupling factor [Propionibacteriaceae bacterium]